MIEEMLLIIFGTIFGLMFIFMIMVAVSVAIDNKYGRMPIEKVPWIFKRGHPQYGRSSHNHGYEKLK